MTTSVLFKALAWLMGVVQHLKNKVERSRGDGCAAFVDNGQSAPAGLVKEPVAKPFPLALSGRRVTGKSQLKLLELLVKKTLVTRAELDNYLGIQNSPDVIMRMGRSGGWEVLKLKYWAAAGGDSRKRRHFYYLLPLDDYSVAKEMLGVAGRSSAPPAAAV